mmetsp:Transcript_111057/g.208204  ORF Transcript_111057/g.208204 Transcript_111057/m.208204 type:complete len:213 (+) Transcript_111057:55-693(+)
MSAAPIFGKQRAQRCQHTRLVLIEIHIAFCNFRDSQGKDVTFLLQTIRVRHICDYIVETVKHLLKPCIATKSHHRSIELEHLIVSSRNLVGAAGARLLSTCLRVLLGTTFRFLTIFLIASAHHVFPQRFLLGCFGVLLTSIYNFLSTCICRSQLLKSILVGFLVIDNLPTLQQCVDSISIGSLHKDNGTTNVIEQPLPARARISSEAITQLH